MQDFIRRFKQRRADRKIAKQEMAEIEKMRRGQKIAARYERTITSPSKQEKAEKKAIRRGKKIAARYEREHA